MALFVCEAADDCHSALRLLDEAVGPHESGAHCVLHLDGRHLGTDRGALQAQIASFLLAAPAGVVLLRRIDQVSASPGGGPSGGLQCSRRWRRSWLRRLRRLRQLAAGSKQRVLRVQPAHCPPLAPTR